MAIYIERECSDGSWSRLIADTPKELSDVVDALGMKRTWLRLGSFPHFVVSQGEKYTRACALGARVCDAGRFSEIVHRLRIEYNGVHHSNYEYMRALGLLGNPKGDSCHGKQRHPERVQRDRNDTQRRYGADRGQSRRPR